MSVRYGMAIDTKSCVGCAACVIACKKENNVPNGHSRDWIFTSTIGSYPELSMTIESRRCNHCENAPCVTVCPTGASYVGPGGTILVNPDKCTGCKACIAACPYGARFVDPRTGSIDKCTFCLHRIEDGLSTTACQEICPTSSIFFGDLSDPESEIAQVLAERDNYTLLPEAGTEPRHYFLK